jgi:hypothetical protein
MDLKTLENLIAAGTPGGIEAQEAHEQQMLVAGEDDGAVRLPRRLIGGCGGGDSRSELERHGITVLGEADDIFYSGRLPEGWRLVPTEHSMWNNILDERGRVAGKIFYKGAFYDRRAHVHFIDEDKRVAPETVS